MTLSWHIEFDFFFGMTSTIESKCEFLTPEGNSMTSTVVTNWLRKEPIVAIHSRGRMGKLIPKNEIKDWKIEELRWMKIYPGYTIKIFHYYQDGENKIDLFNNGRMSVTSIYPSNHKIRYFVSGEWLNRKKKPLPLSFFVQNKFRT